MPKNRTNSQILFLCENIQKLLTASVFIGTILTVVSSITLVTPLNTLSTISTSRFPRTTQVTRSFGSLKLDYCFINSTRCYNSDLYRNLFRHYCRRNRLHCRITTLSEHMLHFGTGTRWAGNCPSGLDVSKLNI